MNEKNIEFNKELKNDTTLKINKDEIAQEETWYYVEFTPWCADNENLT